MKKKRAFHKGTIAAHHQKLEDKQSNEEQSVRNSTLPECDLEDIKNTFEQIVMPKKRKIDDLYKKKVKKQKVKDEDHYISYSAPDRHTEEGYLSYNLVKTLSNVMFLA